MSKYPTENGLDELERKIMKYLWNNVNIDLSMRNKEKLECIMYQTFSMVIAKMFRDYAKKLVMGMIDFPQNEVQDEVR